MCYGYAHRLMLMQGVGIAMQRMHQSYKCMKAQQKKQWVCIQVAYSRIPRALEEAHCWNIQAKFYNEKFPLVYESDKTRDTLSHISLIISSSKQPPYLPIMAFPQPFRDILPCNSHHHHIHDLSIYCHIALHDRKIASMMFSWFVRFLMSLLCQIIAHPGTPPEAFIQGHIFLLDIEL